MLKCDLFFQMDHDAVVVAVHVADIGGEGDAGLYVEPWQGVLHFEHDAILIAGCFEGDAVSAIVAGVADEASVLKLFAEESGYADMVCQHAVVCEPVVWRIVQDR